MQKLLNRIGDRVKKARLALGLTQEALAEKADVHTSYLAQIERGLRAPSLKVLTQISEALGMEIYQLVTPRKVDSSDVDEIALIVELVAPEKRGTFLEAIRRIAQLSR